MEGPNIKYPPIPLTDVESSACRYIDKFNDDERDPMQTTPMFAVNAHQSLIANTITI